jgi:hypothetical protein
MDQWTVNREQWSEMSYGIHSVFTKGSLVYPARVIQTEVLLMQLLITDN